MPPELELKKQYAALEQLIEMITPVLNKTVSAEGFFYDLASINSTDKSSCERLARQINRVMDKIFVAQEQLQAPEKSEQKAQLDALLNKTISFARPVEQTTLGWLASFVMSPKKVLTQRNDISVQKMLDEVIPKTLLLLQFDTLMQPAKRKHQALLKKDAAKSNIGSDICFAANEMLKAAEDARALFISEPDFRKGLESIETIIQRKYVIYEGTFKTHRGIHKNSGQYDVVNVCLDALRALRGLVVAVLTAPGWLYDAKRMKAFIGSYFERPTTDSLRVFGTFYQETKASELGKHVLAKREDDQIKP